MPDQRGRAAHFLRDRKVGFTQGCSRSEPGSNEDSMIRPRRTLAKITLVAAAFMTAATLPAQTLARPGWVGSGLTAQAWFKHAVFYQVDVHSFQDSNGDGTGDLKGVTQHLDYIHSLGVDAVVLQPLAATGAASQAAPIDASLGTLDDLDDLTRQASRLKIRILIELPTPDAALARFWLTRGIAGLYIPGDTAASAAALQAIRKLLAGYVGQRILITDAGSTDSAPARSTNELVLDRVLLQAAGSPVSTQLRQALDQSQSLVRTGTPIFAVSTPAGTGADAARAVVAAILLNRSAALITAGQELGLAPSPNSSATSRTAVSIPWGVAPAAVTGEASEVPRPAAPTPSIASAPDHYTPYVPLARPAAPKKALPPDPATVAGQDALPGSLLNFYRQLSLLYHGPTALHEGEVITLDHDAQNALIWVRKTASPSLVNPPIVIACNLSDKSAIVSLRADMTRLRLRGNFLRTLLRSDNGMGGNGIDPLTIPAHGVYVGALRY